ncbi:MAG: peptidase MA family metallohydrolase [bacterium]
MKLSTALIFFFLVFQSAEDWSVYETEHFRVYYKPGSETLLKNIAPRLEPELSRISELLEASPPGPIKLVIAPDPRSFIEMQGGDISPWVSGRAYPSQSTIMVRPLRGREIRHSSINGVISHEIAHIVLHHKQGKHSPPKWVDEGVAVFMGSEPFWSRSERLMPIALTGKYIPFHSLRHSFPRGPDGASTAYAQSGSFVNFLYNEYGAESFLEFLERLSAGEDHDQALQASFQLPLSRLEDKWLSEVKKSYWLVAVFSGGGLLWFFISLLFIIAYLKKKRQTRERRRLLDAGDTGHNYQASREKTFSEDEDFYYH